MLGSMNFRASEFGRDASGGVVGDVFDELECRTECQICLFGRASGLRSNVALNTSDVERLKRLARTECH